VTRIPATLAVPSWHAKSFSFLALHEFAMVPAGFVLTVLITCTIVKTIIGPDGITVSFCKGFLSGVVFLPTKWHLYGLLKA
jgi:hypothetical protein